MGCHGRREFKFEKYAALPLRMSPFPCCIFDNIETVNVTKDFQHLSIGIREML